MVDSRSWDVEGSRLAGQAAADGEPTRWFEELWSAAARDEVDMPWDRSAPYPPVLAHVDRTGDGTGCGEFGDDIRPRVTRLPLRTGQRRRSRPAGRSEPLGPCPRPVARQPIHA